MYKEHVYQDPCYLNCSSQHGSVHNSRKSPKSANQEWECISPPFVFFFYKSNSVMLLDGFGNVVLLTFPVPLLHPWMNIPLYIGTIPSNWSTHINDIGTIL